MPELEATPVSSILLQREAAALSSAVFAYGSPCNNFHGQLVLRPGGTFYGYRPPHVIRWALEEKEDGIDLILIDEGGKVVSRFRREGRTWSGTLENHRWPLLFAPLLENDAPLPSPACPLPPLLINSIPKSGTYFLEKALASVGWHSLRLHLGHGIVDDYRGLPDEHLHVNPYRVRLACDEDLIAAILHPGQLLVGHLGKEAETERIARLGIKTLPCVRNLRDILVSLYRFKLNKVHPLDIKDALWRKAGDLDRFSLFLDAFRDHDLHFIGDMAATLLAQAEAAHPGVDSFLRYEELENGLLSPFWRKEFENIAPGLAVTIQVALIHTRNTPTPTYSGRRSRWQDHWTPAVEVFFKETGLLELNRRLGYEAQPSGF
ncbi:Sulfotransferase domain-containing protein [Verrucomicrobium sp. GAS474]|uniref:sulfotransferase domain-containing protein n=1 Tax=Verrucomicrobium sp. GAS474 TaxID=1882831 RepID=UPI00087C2898|nr:sulfotransferase domain-containing protein [Verrucomicrobium sp. GAS474]SDU26408.1 Sulfotransferase domain-containing protein [Verrucomicrobium sp. GAS474]